MATRLLTTTVIVALCGGVGGSAGGQNALDRPLQLDPMGNRLRINNPVSRGPGATFGVAQLRNSIVTGNAPNGLSFRGDVGYTAPNEFRGDLGSDDLFAFQRDSLVSGLSGLGVRGTEALQVNFGLTTTSNFNSDFASAAGLLRGESFTPVRGVQSFSPVNLSENQFSPTGGAAFGGTDRAEDLRGRVLEARVLADGGSVDAGNAFMIRSTTGFVSTRSLVGQDLGRSVEQGKAYGYTASPLTGIARREIENEARPETLVRPDPVDARAVVVFSELETGYEAALDTRIETSLNQDEDDSAGLSPLEAYAASLRQYLRTDLSEESAEREDPESGFSLNFDPFNPADDPRAEDADGSDPLSLNTQGSDSERLDPDDPDALPRVSERERLTRALRQVGLDEETLRLLGKQAMLVDRLSESSAVGSRQVFTAHMRAGERLMQAGRYFEAEARYTLALSVAPGDPVAAIGRVHAALGAGLYTSAAINLKEVFRRHPDLVPVRYGEGSLPAPDRIAVAIRKLSERSRDTANPDAALLAELLAYAGYQSQDLGAVRLGLSWVPNDDPMGLLMRLQWLPDDPAVGSANEPAQEAGSELGGESSRGSP
ncbi:MAG: hypothetical protein AAF108_10575 [Planctomycetota bacterium]